MSQVIEGAEGLTITTTAPQAVSGNPKRGIAPLTKPEGWSLTLPDPMAEKSLEDLTNEWGEDKVLELVKASFVIKFQAAIRGMAEAGRPDEEIVEVMKTWKPGQKVTASQSPDQAILRNFGSMPAEQRAELIAKLTAMANS